MRLLTVVLVALLGLVQAELWFGKAGVPHVMRLQGQLRDQDKKNAVAEARNAQLAADVADLKDGLETVEERARFELGMVKPNEIFVHLSAKP
jgi:cell division protein FtsB